MNTTRIVILAVSLGVVPLAAAQDAHHDHDHDHHPAPATSVAPHDDHDDLHNDAHGAKRAHEHEDEHGAEVKLSEAAIRQNDVRIAPAEKRTLEAGVAATAQVVFNEEAMAHVGSPLSGRIVEINARQGMRVKKGDVLLTIQSAELGRWQSEFLQRRIEAGVAAAAVEPAREAMLRAKQLYDHSQGIALAEVQRREADLRTAVGTQASTEAAALAAADALRLHGFTDADLTRLADTRQIDPNLSVRSPINGEVVEREATLGEWVVPETERLLVIADMAQLWVHADVPETQLPAIAPGDRAELEIPSLPGERLAAEVSLINAEIDSATRAGRVRLVIDNAAGGLRPGMFARATLHSAKAGEAVLAIPASAVQHVEGKAVVFVPVEGEPHTFAPREVTIARAVNGYVPVLSGIEAGQPVVVSGSFILKAELGKGAAEHSH